MNKNYGEWGNTGWSSAFERKLGQMRDLQDLEKLTAQYAKSISALPVMSESPSKASGKDVQEEFMIPIDKESLLYNRSHFDRALDYEVSRALRYHRHVSVCIANLDNVDNIIASLGRQRYSHLISSLGRAFKDTLRGIDIPARFSDTTFAVILPETDSAGATVVAERVRSIFKKTGLACGPRDRDLGITASVGCACFPSHAKTAQGLVDSASKSLGTAAQRGGDVACML